MTSLANATNDASEKILLERIVCCPTQMLLATCGGNLAQARRTAFHMVNDYCARGPADLLFVTQIISFGLAALSSLSRSMLPGRRM